MELHQGMAARGAESNPSRVPHLRDTRRGLHLVDMDRLQEVRQSLSLASPCLVLAASPCLALLRLASPCLASPRLASPRLASPLHCFALPRREHLSKPDPTSLTTGLVPVLPPLNRAFSSLPQRGDRKRHRRCEQGGGHAHPLGRARVRDAHLRPHRGARLLGLMIRE